MTISRKISDGAAVVIILQVNKKNVEPLSEEDQK